MTAVTIDQIEDEVTDPPIMDERNHPPQVAVNVIHQDKMCAINDGEESAMAEEQLIVLTRKKLYDEIWEISLAGVAKKYDIQYSWLARQVKSASIPIPPSGYWTMLSFGKHVIKPDLMEPFDALVTISKPSSSVRKESKQPPKEKRTIEIKPEAKPALSKAMKIDKPVEHSDLPETQALPSKESVPVEEQPLPKPETYMQYSQSYNVYDRQTLYNEVWAHPVTEVAKQYKVSDVAIHKVCKSLDIPTPPLGYWAKVYAKKPVTKIPLPESSKPSKKTGLSLRTEYQPKYEKGSLDYLSEEDRAIILAIASQIRLPDDNARMHHIIIEHRKKVEVWKKNQKDNPPLLANTVSDDTLLRVHHIIDALIKAIEPLGCTLLNDLVFRVNGEDVSITVTEARDEVPHIPTKDENMQLLKYQDAQRHNSWAPKPNIRKYDRPYNGRICFTVRGTRIFRDTNAASVEDRLGDIMIALYEQSDAVRKLRLAKEEAERKRKEEERLREDRRDRYNNEIEKTCALVNLAEDFDIACKIRHYIAAVETTANQDEKVLTFITWAKDKADWYDPTIARRDELLGIRDHEKDKDEKALKKTGLSWWQR